MLLRIKIIPDGRSRLVTHLPRGWEVYEEKSPQTKSP